MTLHEQVLQALRDRLGSHDVNESSRLREDLGLDSLELVQLGLELEDEFTVKIENQHYDRIATVGDIVRLLQELKGAL